MKKTIKYMSLIIGVVFSVISCVMLLSSCADKQVNAIECSDIFTKSGEGIDPAMTATSEGTTIYVVALEVNFKKIEIAHITLDEGLAGLKVLAVAIDERSASTVEITVQGNITNPSLTGAIIISSKATGGEFIVVGEIAISQPQFTVVNTVDYLATTHAVEIVSSEFKSSDEVLATDVVFEAAFANMQFVSAQLNGEKVTINFSGQVDNNANDYGNITLAAAATGFYKSITALVEIIHPEIIAKNDTLNPCDSEQIVYFAASKFSFNQNIALADVSLTFFSDEQDKAAADTEIQQLAAAITITRVQNIFGVVAVTIDINESIYPAELNENCNHISVTFTNKATTLSRDIMATIYIDSVYMFYEASESIDASDITITFSLNATGGVFSDIFAASDISVDGAVAKSTKVSIEEGIMKIELVFAKPQQSQIVDITLNNVLVCQKDITEPEKEIYTFIIEYIITAKN